MGKQLYIGLAVEGNTDMRFLHSVVFRTFRKILFDKSEQIIDVDVLDIKGDKIGHSFREFVASASKEGVEKYGILILAVHSDSDKETLKERMDDKFIPAMEYVCSLDNELYCKEITPIIPIRMIEAWMLADTALLKSEMGTSMRDSDLGFSRNPESIADPKSLIIRAIAKSEETMPKKRRGLTIGDLYGIIGDKLSIEKLERLSSFQSFEQFVEKSLRAIRYIQ